MASSSDLPRRRCPVPRRASSFGPAILVVLALSSSAYAASFAGDWRFQQKNDNMPDHRARIVLMQEGDAITGSWSDNFENASSGCVRGSARSKSFAAQTCTTNGAPQGRAACPSYSSGHDRFDLAGTSLVWNRYDERARKWVSYMKLERRGATDRKEIARECRPTR